MFRRWYHRQRFLASVAKPIRHGITYMAPWEKGIPQKRFCTPCSPRVCAQKNKTPGKVILPHISENNLSHGKVTGPAHELPRVQQEEPPHGRQGPQEQDWRKTQPEHPTHADPTLIRELQLEGFSELYGQSRWGRHIEPRRPA